MYWEVACGVLAHKKRIAFGVVFFCATPRGACTGKGRRLVISLCAGHGVRQDLRNATIALWRGKREDGWQVPAEGLYGEVVGGVLSHKKRIAFGVVFFCATPADACGNKSRRLVISLCAGHEARQSLRDAMMRSGGVIGKVSLLRSGRNKRRRDAFLPGSIPPSRSLKGYPPYRNQKGRDTKK